MNNTARRTLTAIALAGAALTVSGTAHAADPAPPQTSNPMYPGGMNPTTSGQPNSQNPGGASPSGMYPGGMPS